MPTDSGKILDLRALQHEIAGRVELADGVHEVRKLNVAQYQATLAIDHQGDPSAALEASVQLVAEIVPGLPVERVRQLPPAVLAAIIALATQGVAAVEALLPNAPSPENPSSTSPG